MNMYTHRGGGKCVQTTNKGPENFENKQQVDCMVEKVKKKQIKW